MDFSIKNKIKNISQSIQYKIKQIFCCHIWMQERNERFKVVRTDRSEEGEVVLGFIICSKCEKNKIIIYDRIRYKKKD